MLLLIKVLISVSNIILNSFLIHALRRRNKLRILSYWLIVCLCISDIFVGVFGLLCEALVIGSKENTDIDFITSSILMFWVNFSTSFVLIIATDRYIHMKHTVRYQIIMTKRRAVWLVLFNVLFTVHMLVTVRLLPKYQKDFLRKHLLAYRIYRVLLGVVYITIILVISGLYITTYFSIKRRVENTSITEEVERRDATRTEESTQKTQRRRSVDREFAKVMGLVTAILFLCLFPNLCMNLYTRTHMLIKGYSKLSDQFRFALQLTFLTMQLNSSLNAAIILFFNRELRQYTKQSLKDFVNCKCKSAVI